MQAKLARLRPKRHDVIYEGLRLWLSLPFDLTQETRNELADALGRYSPPETWRYVMLNPDQQRLVLREINSGPRPHATLKVWNAAISRLSYDTGEVMATRFKLAEDADVSPTDASRALNRLAEIGALERLARGRYAINPFVGWAGSLGKREEAAKDAPRLKLVEET